MISEIKPSINLSDPLVLSEAFNNSVSYIIKTADSSGKYECARLYSEFCSLRKILTKKWPGIYIPPIPNKPILSKFSSKSVTIYKKQIEYFLVYITRFVFLYSTDEFQFFVKSKVPFSRKYKTNLYEASIACQAIFHEYLGRHITEDMAIALNHNQKFFKENLESLIIFREKSEALMKEFKQYYNLLSNTSNQLSRVEKSCKLGSEDKEVYSRVNLSNIKNHYVELYIWAESEIFEIESILEAINTCSGIESIIQKLESSIASCSEEIEKVHQNKTSLLRIFSFKSKEKFTIDMKQKVFDEENQLINLKALYSIVVARLLDTDIPFFKTTRTNCYFDSHEQYNLMLSRSLGTLSDSATLTLKNIQCTDN